MSCIGLVKTTINKQTIRHNTCNNDTGCYLIKYLHDDMDETQTNVIKY